MGRDRKYIEGVRIGSLTILKKDPHSGKYDRYICRCDCGAEVSLERKQINSGHQSCGCKKGIEKEVLEELYINRGLSSIEIGSLLGFHRNTVARYLKIYGLRNADYLPECRDEINSTARRGPLPYRYIGKKFGTLTCTGYTGDRLGFRPILRFRCDCGEELERIKPTAREAATLTCGKCKPVKIIKNCRRAFK